MSTLDDWTAAVVAELGSPTSSTTAPGTWSST